MLEAALIILVVFLLLVSAFSPVQHFAGPRTTWMLSKLPGPKSLPVLGVGLRISRLKPTELLDFLAEIANEFPRVAKLWVAALPFVLVSQPEDVEIIMGSTLHIEKGVEYNPLLMWLKEGLLVSSGNKWHTRRKILTPTFHFRILQDNLTSLNKHARSLLKNMLKNGEEPFEVEKYINLCTLDVICETAMGISLNSQDNQGQEYVESIKRVSTLTVERILRFWLYQNFVFTLTSIGREFKQHLNVLHNFTEKIIRERKKYYATKNVLNDEEDESFGKKRKAFLDSMIEMDMKYPNSFTDLDIREEVDTFMFEGHDTTSAALSFACYLLGRHAYVQEKVYQEQLSIFGTSDRDVTMKDLQDMSYLEKVLKETLRLYPSVPYLSRMLTHDAPLGDNTILPKGTNVMILPYLVHRNPRFFPDPEVFNPERFDPEECAKRHPYAYIPFSAGPRNCIGQKFAMMELKVVISTLIRFSKLETLTNPNDVKLVPLLILRTDKPIVIRATPRVNFV